MRDAVLIVSLATCIVNIVLATWNLHAAARLRRSTLELDALRDQLYLALEEAAA